MTEGQSHPCRLSGEVDPQAHLVEVFELLGRRWSGVIIGALLRGPARFNELSRQVSGISDSVLNERLRALMAAGLVERQLADGPATAVLYQLTPAGEDFRAAFEELRAWSIRNQVIS
ncbi:winged helix-turn-helix transcriptional regulator [Plantactinospora sp. WMMB334]|uniref:winged helix-turn-helix transcriptional regulator n=1 Tax=Plantactinospora sp. WMMB334 TaxID=3404119 RepID=UPI003B924748